MGARHHGWRWAAVLPVLAVMLTGCGGNDDKAERPPPVGNVVQPGAPGEPSRKLDAEQVAELESAKHTKADVRFMQAMIHHHGQAVLMTRWVPRRTTSKDVRLMSRRIELSQEAEIDRIERWLRERGVKPRDPGDHGGHDHGTGEGMPPGMLTSGQLGRLYNTDGRAFDRLFLRYMTHHHQGALTMVRQLRAEGGDAEPEINAFTREVDADQHIEILRMRELSARFR